MVAWWWGLALGLGVGGISGVLGIGGGVMLVPGMMLLFGFSQQKAQGTSLAALVPPVGIFAALQYYRQGFVDPWAALWIAVGFTAGAFFTAGYVRHIPVEVLSFLFGSLLLFLGVKLILLADRGANVVAWALVALCVAWLGFFCSRALGRHWRVRPSLRAQLKARGESMPADIEYYI